MRHLLRMFGMTALLPPVYYVSKRLTVNGINGSPCCSDLPTNFGACRYCISPEISDTSLPVDEIGRCGHVQAAVRMGSRFSVRNSSRPVSSIMSYVTYM